MKWFIQMQFYSNQGNQCFREKILVRSSNFGPSFPLFVRPLDIKIQVGPQSRSLGKEVENRENNKIFYFRAVELIAFTSGPDFSSTTMLVRY